MRAAGPAFDLISAIWPSRIRNENRCDCCGRGCRFERAAQHHTRGGNGTRLSEPRLLCAKGTFAVREGKTSFRGRNVMSPISKKLAAKLVVLGLTTSLGALGITLGMGDVALAGKPGGGGGKVGGGGGGRGWGGGGGGHISAPHFSGAHYSGGHVSSHASHWSGSHH